MKQLNLLVTALFIFLGVQFIQAQDSEAPSYSRLPIKLSVGSHTVGFPFQNLFSSPNSSLAIGTELGINKNRKHQLYTAANLGFVRNKAIGNTATLSIDLGYRFTSKSNLFFESALGIGMANQFHPTTIYQLNSDTEVYEEVKDRGINASLIGLDVGLGYDFSNNSSTPFKLSIHHRFFIQSPYFDVESFPIMPQSITNITLTYKFKKS